MKNPKNQHCRKNEYQKIGFDLKLSIIDQVTNGQISINHASKLHGISRSSISYWMKKLRTFDQNSKTMSKNQEIKKLKDRIEELEFIKDFQQIVIAEMEITTGIDIVKKSMPEALIKEIEKKEKRPFKIRYFYECFGITKQAYYKRIKAEKLKQQQTEIILELIRPIRKEQSKYGGRKLFLDLQDDFKKNNIKMGRDAFFAFLRYNRLLVKKTKRYHVTTDSKHGFYKSPNRLDGLTPTHAEQVWVSDITYVKIQQNHAYVALVTDAYSKKIMGYKIDTNMKATLVKQALQMALKNRLYSHQNIIHHSDRGIQYCCPEFSDFAQEKGMLLSTTQKYDPYENAVAERVNGILKYEFGFIKTLPNLVTAKKMLKQAVNIYNKQRRHYSLEMKTPEFAHRNQEHEYKSYSLN